MLVCGDIHGNYSKAKTFLQYKPEEKHIFVGDYTDSFKATDHEIIETIRLIFESDAIKLAGNHDIQYLANAHSYFQCSGKRYAPEFGHLINMYKNELTAAIYEDDYVITHGGVTRLLGRNFERPSDLVDWLNEELKWYIDRPVAPDSLSPIFHIGSCRGGREQSGGIFWADYRYEKFDIRFNQVFGHSHGKDPKKMSVGKKDKTKFHVLVDIPQFYCYNTKTHQFEDFMPEDVKKNRDMLERSY